MVLHNNAYKKFDNNYVELDLLLCYLDYGEESIKEIYFIDKIVGLSEFQYKNVHVTSNVKNNLIAFHYIKYQDNKNQLLDCYENIYIWEIKKKEKYYEFADSKSSGLQTCPIYFSSTCLQQNYLTKLKLKKSQ